MAFFVTQRKLALSIIIGIALLESFATPAIAGNVPISSPSWQPVLSKNNGKPVQEKCVTLQNGGAEACLQRAGREIPSEDILKDPDALNTYVKNFGLAKTIARLHALEVSGHGDCHQPAHQAGRLAYALVGMDAFNEISPECQFGGFHGAAHSHFKERGTTHLADDVRRICPAKANAFYTYQCGHGIGHGLLAATDYDLPVALELCNEVLATHDACWSGVFMENILASRRGHHVVPITKYVNDDPQYPCTIVADLYKKECYGFQPARMMQLFAGDFGRVANSCGDLPAVYQDGCFEGMGREASGASQRKPKVTIQSCRQAPKGRPRVQCLTGAVNDSFWDPAGQDPALTFCALLNDKAEKDACYETIFSGAPEILFSRREIQNFCAKAEASYRRSCLKKRTVSN
jgi:hypothetical protein